MEPFFVAADRDAETADLNRARSPARGFITNTILPRVLTLPFEHLVRDASLLERENHADPRPELAVVDQLGDRLQSFRGNRNQEEHAAHPSRAASSSSGCATDDTTTPPRFTAANQPVSASPPTVSTIRSISETSPIVRAARTSMTSVRPEPADIFHVLAERGGDHLARDSLSQLNRVGTTLPAPPSTSTRVVAFRPP